MILLEEKTVPSYVYNRKVIVSQNPDKHIWLFSEFLYLKYIVYSVFSCLLIDKW